jgi:hypothetical protein
MLAPARYSLTQHSVTLGVRKQIPPELKVNTRPQMNATAGGQRSSATSSAALSAPSVSTGK